MNGSADSNRRLHIVRTAARLFRTKGYERATIRDLACANDLQSGSLFHYFDSKEDILFAVISQALTQTTAAAEAALAGCTGAPERLRALIYCELDSVCGDTADGMIVAAFQWRKLSEPRQKELIDIRNRYEDLWRLTLEDAQAQGLLTIDAFLLRRFLNGALSWTSTWYRPDGPRLLEDLAEAALDMALGRRSPTETLTSPEHLSEDSRHASI